MVIFEWVGAGVLGVLVVLFALFIRRGVIARRSGTVEVSMRLSTLIEGRGWSPGLARFVGEQLRWYRVFSLAFRARRVLTRHGLAIESRRRPDGPERLVLPSDWIIVRCVSNQAPVEIAMSENTLTGFLSWVEAAPPGTASMRLKAQ